MSKSVVQNSPPHRSVALSTGARLIVPCLWLALLFVIYVRPISISQLPTTGLQQGAAPVWVPFSDHYGKPEDPPHFLDVMLWWAIKALTFLPLGLFLTLNSRKGRGTAVGALFAILAVPIALAVMQFFVPGRIPSMTDVVLGILGGLGGCALAKTWRSEPVPRGFWSYPLFWLFFQAGVLVIAVTYWDHLKPANWGDTDDGYVGQPITEELTFKAFVTSLTHQKSIGYPLFVRLVRAVTPERTVDPEGKVFDAARYLEVAFRLSAMIVFYAGLRCLGVGAWLSMGAASCLLYSTTFQGLLKYILSDPLAESFCILSLGWLLVLVGYPRSALAWAGLTFCVFGTCLIRPGYVFLAGLLPLFGVLLRGMVRPEPGWLWRSRSLAAGVFLASALPVLSFCGLRYALVGDFAVASTSGGPLFGIAGQFLSDKLVNELPPHLQPFAGKALEIRNGLENWQVALDEKDRLLPHVGSDWNPAEGAGHTDLFSRTAMEVGYPAVVEAYQLDFDLSQHAYHQDHVLLDRKLKELSVAVLKARLPAYGQWLARSTQEAFRILLINNDLLKRLGLLLALLAIIWHGLYLLQHLGLLSRPHAAESSSKNYLLEFHILLLLGSGFALAGMVPIILVAIPNSRYIDALSCYLPCVAVVTILALARQVRQMVAFPAALGHPLRAPFGLSRFTRSVSTP